ncbi:MAG TPA: hypothetical protein VMO76_14800 [Candidatus Udaeobacter sp.]|nr:hypothetical protein [Candidatus Udaeobacter sp.]
MFGLKAPIEAKKTAEDYALELHRHIEKFVQQAAEDGIDHSRLAANMADYFGNFRYLLAQKVAMRKVHLESGFVKPQGASYDARRGVETR